MIALGVSYDFKLGDVIQGKGKLAKHPILFIQDTDDDSFEGCMLTRSPLWEGNLPLEREFIKEFDEEGNRFEFQFRNTHVVQARLEKKKDWAPFWKVGELTEEGIEFVMTVINGLEPQQWEDYKKSSKRK